MRRAKIEPFEWVTMAGAALLLIGFLLSGCATPEEGYLTARKVQGGGAVSLLASYEGWIQWDAKQQDIIIDNAKSRDEGREELSSYRRTVQAPIVLAFKTGREAVQQLQTGLDATDAIKRGEWGGLIGKVIASFLRIADLFTQYKVAVEAPKVPL